MFSLPTTLKHTHTHMYLLPCKVINMDQCSRFTSKEASKCALGMRSGCLLGIFLLRFSEHVKQGDQEVDPEHAGEIIQ